MNDKIENQYRETNEPTVDVKVLLSDMWRGFIKFWWIFLFVVLICGGIQYYKSYIRYIPMYKCTATFTVHTENSSLTDNKGIESYSFYYNQSTADQLEKVFPYLLQSKILQDQICLDLNLPYMPASVSAAAIPGSNMITLNTISADAQSTYNVLLSVVKNYSSVAEYIIGRSRLVMITEPEIPADPYNKMAWKRSVAKGLAFGGLIGLMGILIYAIMRRTIRTKEDIHKVLKQHCLGILPQVIFKKYRKKINKEILLNNPHIGNDFLEALRFLRSSVQNRSGEDHKIITVTSTAPAEGKSVTTVNLAAIYKRDHEKILVIDLDFRNSGIQNILRHAEKIPVEEIDGEYQIDSIKELGFDLLTFKRIKSQSRRILHSWKLNVMLKEYRKEYDMIFIDTPPFGIISDALTVADLSDGVIYVVRQDMVLSGRIQNCINMLQSSGIQILGCVLTGATGGLGGYGSQYGYGGYHKYYYSGYKRRYGYGSPQTQKH